MFNIANFTGNTAAVRLEGLILLSAEPVGENWNCFAFRGANPIYMEVNRQRNSSRICSIKKRIDRGKKMNLFLSHGQVC